MREMLRDFNLSAASAGLSAFIFMVFGALSLQVAVVNQFGLAEAQARSWIFVTWLTTALVSLPLIIRYRQPLGIGWTIPGLVYLGSLAGQFTFQEMVGANLMAGVAIILFGVLGVGGRIVYLVPLPILMGMFAASIVEFITRLADATAHRPAMVGPMLAAYLLARALNNPRIPPVGIAAAVGAAMIVVLGGVDPVPVDVGLPGVVVPGWAMPRDSASSWPRVIGFRPTRSRSRWER
jgi:benzoate membrane transport protein